ncbi:L,D-transpeptidase family protein [Candidatus Electronema sp. PJ]|uniref:L,D-transpeptidase family protein n=1 Tax=Candidatus Electronema sp. PJ TaxID=3401572 RepID=UPI003AA94563
MANARPRVERQLAAKGLQLGAPIFMRVFKQPKQLEVWLQKGSKFSLFKTYPICAYSGRVGPKLREGDQQSPEGFYSVSAGQLNPDSRYHLSFDIGYPNAVDRENKRTGGDIMVHGKCISQGCLAMGNLQVEEIYLLAHQAFLKGQKQFNIHIFPFRMTKENVEKNRYSPWYSFWQNLREGYDAFELERRVPFITADNDRYEVRKASLQSNVVMVNQQIAIEEKKAGSF